MSDRASHLPDLHTLARLFYHDLTPLGDFEEVEQEALPPVARGLLAHHGHMTVTLEAFHGCPVDVNVLDRLTTGDHYARKIVLRRQSDHQVVLFGLVRLNAKFLRDDVLREIQTETVPLGRVLISHGVMREVQLVALWRAACGADLAMHTGLEPGASAYGRTALIYCDGAPGVELLEIVTSS